MMQRIIVEYLANALWQLPLLVLAASALLWATGAAARRRHQVWLAVLACALLLPLRGLAPASPPPPAMSVAQHAAIPADAGAVTPVPPSAIAPAPSGWRIGAGAARALTLAWFAIVALGLLRLLRSWAAAQALLRRADGVDLPPRVMAIFAQAAESLGVAPPRLRQSDETASPMVIGAWRPVLLLPRSFQDLREDEITAALCHELAHVARRDYAINLACQLAALPLLWHPATHLVLRRIRDSREMICDKVAADEMNSPLHYATCLVAVALRVVESRPAAATQALHMFENRSLEERILHLTERPASLPEPVRRLRLTGGLSGVAGALLLAVALHVSPSFAEPEQPTDLLPPAAPAAPPAPPAPAEPAIKPTAEMRRAIAAEARERAAQTRDAAHARRDAEKAARDRDREAAEALREKAEQERELAATQAEATREQAEAGREAIREQMESLRQQGRIQARQAAEMVKSIDFGAINEQVKEATALVDKPEFRRQMAELRQNIAQLHRNMEDLNRHMAEMNRQMEKLSGEASN